MNLRSGDLPPLKLEMNPSMFYEKLSGIDKQNVQELVHQFGVSATALDLHGAVIGIGGTLTKPAPRKDADLIVLLYDSLGRQYHDAVKVFSRFQELVTKAVQLGSGLAIEEINPPKRDHMYEEHGLTLDDGHILVRPKNGIIIDLIPVHATDLAEFRKKEYEQYSVLGYF
ncbi:hypothetical protein A2363_03375 [Candidatus Gottesmanbacteria bacterium RIFOXYB1_FULL_47_11]|uniref:Polymerase nucleotidyl transferase domain-containing protein n=1 Tax=Candidatus Gottesmanbacteria bacterium RIFOXYB1_FULL_47_11 TaxID=1798401 RepID=A0A1F6BF32_9BACT|nr:MAG: hypothetical protein A2363_03375 [Candidatus Gottesmanbacteria bacterium RIFOXYB1_FULL_47_11]